MNRHRCPHDVERVPVFVETAVSADYASTTGHRTRMQKAKCMSQLVSENFDSDRICIDPGLRRIPANGATSAKRTGHRMWKGINIMLISGKIRTGFVGRLLRISANRVDVAVCTADRDCKPSEYVASQPCLPVGIF